MTDTGHILSTAKVVCTAKQPVTDGHSRLGFSSLDGGPGATVGPLGLSTVMPNADAQHIDVGKHLTLIFTDAEVD